MSEVSEYSVTARFRLATFAFLNDRSLVEDLHAALNAAIQDFAKANSMTRSDLKIDLEREGNR